MEGAFYLSGEADVVERHLDASMQEERVREEETTDEVVTKDCEMDDVLL
jgi:hypothetical protein